MTRCTLLVDNVARWFCAAVSAASCPLPAVKTTSGLSAKSVRAAAGPAADDWRYSSMVLRRLPAVAILALTSSRDRGGRPLAANVANSDPSARGAVLDANAETRPVTSYDVRSPGDAAAATPEAGAVESISTMPATS